MKNDINKNNPLGNMFQTNPEQVRKNRTNLPTAEKETGGKKKVPVNTKITISEKSATERKIEALPYKEKLQMLEKLIFNRKICPKKESGEELSKQEKLNIIRNYKGEATVEGIKKEDWAGFMGKLKGGSSRQINKKRGDRSNRNSTAKTNNKNKGPIAQNKFKIGNIGTARFILNIEECPKYADPIRKKGEFKISQENWEKFREENFKIINAVENAKYYKGLEAPEGVSNGVWKTMMRWANTQKRKIRKVSAQTKEVKAPTTLNNSNSQIKIQKEEKIDTTRRGTEAGLKKLLSACEKGALEETKELIKWSFIKHRVNPQKEDEVKARNDWNQHGRRQADPTKLGPEGKTPLHVAIENAKPGTEHLDIIKLFFEDRVDVRKEEAILLKKLYQQALSSKDESKIELYKAIISAAVERLAPKEFEKDNREEAKKTVEGWRQDLIKEKKEATEKIIQVKGIIEEVNTTLKSNKLKGRELKEAKRDLRQKETELEHLKYSIVENPTQYQEGMNYSEAIRQQNDKIKRINEGLKKYENKKAALEGYFNNKESKIDTIEKYLNITPAFL